MPFDLPKDIDDFYATLMIILFLIGYCINVYAGGNATLIFIEDKYNLNPDSQILDLNSNEYYIQKYASNTLSNNRLVFHTSMFLFWILMPLVCFYYGYFRFKHELRKPLFTFFQKIRRVNSLTE